MLFAPAPLHIPDGFLSLVIAVIFWIPSVAAISLALRQVGTELGERQVPLMGVLAAAIFAGQMLNFTIAGGTSGHLLGATLATILLGPWAAMLVMTCVVSVQALIFQDGGLLALGANLFNMGVIGVSISYLVYHTIQKLAGKRTWSMMIGGFAAAWASVFISALSVGLQLALSGVSPANIAIPAMAGVHALIGAGEGLITVGALAFLSGIRRDLLIPNQTASSGTWAIWIGGLGITTILAIASPLASSDPDGLETVASQLGILEMERQPVYELFSGYMVPGVSNEAMATILAAVIGGLIVLVTTWGVASNRRKQQSDPG
jgi:cobalt/nickel transport system permease protein